MKDLNSYLSDAGETNAGFGKKVGLTETSVWRIRHGHQWPSKETAERIFRVSGGQVVFGPSEKDWPKIRKAGR